MNVAPRLLVSSSARASVPSSSWRSFTRTARLSLVTATLLGGAFACSSSGSEGGPATGGASATGGKNTGGAATGGSTNTGGNANTGGAATGGSTNTGGSATGGSATGGSATGGKGGSAPGGSGTGGSTGGKGGATGGGAGGAATGGNGGGGAATGGSGGNSNANGQCPSSATFCSGFEEAGIPTGAVYNPSYMAANWAQFISFDTTIKHGGNQSLLIKTNNSAYDPRLLTVKAPGKTFWVRLYMRTDIPFGKGQDHNSFFLATSSAMGDVNTKGLEVGEQMCEVELNGNDNRQSSIGGNPNGCAGQTGKTISDKVWHCVEAFFDGAGGNYQVFSDNEPIVDVKNWTPSGLSTNFVAFSFGSMHFNGDPTTNGRQIWYDDVAVGPQRIGCLP